MAHMDDQNLKTTNKPLLEESPCPITEEGPNRQPSQQGNKKPTNNLNQRIKPQQSSTSQSNPEKSNKNQKSYEHELGPYKPHIQKNQLTSSPKDNFKLPEIILPSYITPYHDQYTWIIQQCNLPCRYCKSRDSQVVMRTGLISWSWCVCLTMLCFVGLFFCCPLNDNRYKNIIIRCISCRRLKAKVQRTCWGDKQNAFNLP